MDLTFWKGKRVFITGHTGFKGSWLCRVLTGAGADITGYALTPPTNPNLFSISGIEDKINSCIGDIRDRDMLARAFDKSQPEIVIHMAAQPLVRDSYKNPAYTYETNMLGTVNILECVRTIGGVKSFLNVTTDKVYHNNEWEWGYRETDALDGFDPYSNSKSCAELITRCYRDSFFLDKKTAISTARAGNVIGGGDFANDRIIPDCIRAAATKKNIIIRNPISVRPYQHVLEPLFAYLLIANKQYEDTSFMGSYNVGPDDKDCVSTGVLADLFCKAWGDGQSWETPGQISGPHEANFLKLDCSKIKSRLGFRPRWSVDEAVKRTVEWTRVYMQKGDVCAVMDEQILLYKCL
ncbi:MAG: CDP-glucose 4,6-dehydratase [Defluviitaleaceae bacterium]|nr:CDP-glucose 4,6-dehydratase [Defluviitaleaceae bacterium]